MFLLLSPHPIFFFSSTLKANIIRLQNIPYTVLKDFDPKLIWTAKDHLSDFPHPSMLFYSLPAH